LTYLDISQNDLKQLPPYLLQIAGMRTVIANKNKLQSLPNDIGSWVQLTTLDLENNKFTKLPDSIGNIQSLTNLNVAYNGIRVLPDSFVQLNKLKVLILSDNPALTSLPDFDNFPQLVRLHLRNLQLPNLSTTIGTLQFLEELELRDNSNMKAIPQEIGQLANLQRLDLYGNRLKQLPASIGNLRALRVIDLRQNNFLYRNVTCTIRKFSVITKNIFVQQQAW